jgi:GT2 family glycosyltransferase
VIQEIDVVMLAFTQSRTIYEMNVRAIASLRASEPEIIFRIRLLESNPDFEALGWQYDAETQVIYPRERFNFNRYNNLGAGLGTAAWIVFSNNDVVYAPGWCTALLAVHAQRPRIRCLCPVDDRSQYTPPGTFHPGETHRIGHHVRITFTGWCFMVQRSVFAKTGPFDERFDYYFADDDFTMQLRRADILNAAVMGSHVHHLAHVTSRSSALAITEKFKTDQAVFQAKWGSQRLIAWKNRLVENVLRPLGMKALIRQLYRHN